jgi:hypothetical protein
VRAQVGQVRRGGLGVVRRRRRLALLRPSHRRLRGDHSITSSARPSSDGGIVRPRALAVLRLITRLNLVGRSTSNSAGLAPFRMRRRRRGGTTPKGRVRIARGCRLRQSPAQSQPSADDARGRPGRFARARAKSRDSPGQAHRRLAHVGQSVGPRDHQCHGISQRKGVLNPFCLAKLQVP